MATVVAAGTAMTPVANKTGAYLYAFTPPEPGHSFNWNVVVTYQGTPVLFPQLTYNDLIIPTSIFSTFQMLVNHYGMADITTWSNKNKNGRDPDFNAIQDAFTNMDGEITDCFRGTRFHIPLDFSPNAGSVPTRVKMWHRDLSAYEIYNSRGFNQRDRTGNKFQKRQQEIYREIGFAKAGLWEMPAVLATDTMGHTADGKAGIVGPGDVPSVGWGLRRGKMVFLGVPC